MGKIVQLQSKKTGENEYPRTYTKAVIDDNGTPLPTLMQLQEDKITELGSKVGRYIKYTSETDGYVNIPFQIKRGEVYIIKNTSEGGKLNLRGLDSALISREDIVVDLKSGNSAEYTAGRDLEYVAADINIGGTFYMVEKDSVNMDVFDTDYKLKKDVLPNVVFGMNTEEIPDGSNLDDYKTAGVYRIKNSESAATIVGKPSWIINSSILQVVVNYTGYAIQIIYNHITPMSVRTFNLEKQTWSEWMILTSKDELNAAIERVTDAQKRYVAQIGNILVGNAGSAYVNYPFQFVIGHTYILKNTSENAYINARIRKDVSSTSSLADICNELKSGDTYIYTSTVDGGAIGVSSNGSGTFEIFDIDTEVGKVLLSSSDELIKETKSIDKKIADNNILYSSLSFGDNGYLMSYDSVVTGGQGTIVADIVMGDDVISDQCVWNTNLDRDGLYIRIKDGIIYIRINNALANLGEVKPNERYLISASLDGRVSINDQVYKFDVTIPSEFSGFIVGALRKTPSLIFKGRVRSIKVEQSNLTALKDSEYKDRAKSSYVDGVYLLPSNLKNGKLKDIDGSYTLEAYNSVTVNIESSDVRSYIIGLKNRIEDIESIKNILSDVKGFVGAIRKNGISATEYSESIGDVSDVFKHFKIGLVKDGVLQYFTNQTVITESENGMFDTILDGTDGDVLIVNDVPIYYLIYPTENYDLKLFSLTPFTYLGEPSKCLQPRGDAPCLCYIDNVDSDGQSTPHELHQLLGGGKTHCVRNFNYVSNGNTYFRPMGFVKGRYIPIESNGTISYTYDESGKYIESGAVRPTNYADLRTVERAAMNKGEKYTNKDVLSKEILIAMLDAELKTKMYFSQNLFGAGWCSYNNATSASPFEDGSLAQSGIRFKNNSGEWVYSSLNETPFNEFQYNEFIYCLLCDWFTPWEILEQHMVVAYITQNNISANTWFVHNGFEYKYLNIPGIKGLSDGVMTCVLQKKFRTKLNNVTLKDTNEDLTGNDIEFLISSSIYRGWVLDNAPQIWLTGVNVVCTNEAVTTYVQHNYKKYLMDKSYGGDENIIRGLEIADKVEVWDFEKIYELASVLPNNDIIMFAKSVSDKCIMTPNEVGGTLTSYECCAFETDKVGNRGDIDSSKKIITGVKSGYGPYSNVVMNFLYMNHPRTDTAARTCYSSFVCQEVEV